MRGDDLCSIFLQEFVQENYAFYQEKHLRARVQEADEPVTAYYYDELALEWSTLRWPRRSAGKPFRWNQPAVAQEGLSNEAEDMCGIFDHCQATLGGWRWRMAGQRKLNPDMVGAADRGKGSSNFPAPNAGAPAAPKIHEDLTKLVLEF